MFDSKEIAKRSLLLAEQIQQERTRKKRNAIRAGSALSVCAVVLVGAFTVFTQNAADYGIYIDDAQIPLYMYPPIYYEKCIRCGAKSEYEQCEECE